MSPKAKKACYILIPIVILGIIVHFLMAHSPPHRPSGYAWIQARIDGRGDPDYPIEGTVESRFDNFLIRHPAFKPEWRDVPDEQNGFTQLHEFIVVEDIEGKLRLDSSLREMSYEGTSWDQQAVEKHLNANRDMLTRLREIAAMPDRSSKGFDDDKRVNYRANLITMLSDNLALSFTDNLKNQNLKAAYRDFTSIFGIAAHLDRHEVPTYLDKSIGVLTRLRAISAISKNLSNLPHETDWSPFVDYLESQLDPWLELSNLCFSEGWYCMRNWVLPAYIDGDELNPAWDFTAFENAYAKRIFYSSIIYKTHRYATDSIHYEAVKKCTQVRENVFPSEMRETILNVPSEAWDNGYKRYVEKTAYTLMALKILQIEQQSGPVTDASDPRLKSISTAPFDGPTFGFDPATREVLPGPVTHLMDEEIITLPPYPANTP